MPLFSPKEIFDLSDEGSLSAQHVSLRPTKLCRGMLILGAAIWIGAANYQVNVVYAICFWVLGFIGVSALMTRRQLLGLRLHADYTGEVFAGEEAEVRLLFDGGGRARVFWWHGSRKRKTEDTGEGWTRCQLSGSLKTDKTAQVWRIPIKHRGYFPRPLRLTLATTAPFGLFQAECRAQWQTDAIAYPAPLPHQDYGTQNEPDSEQPPQGTGTQGDDIAYLKNHQSGAPMQHVAWKAYARSGELMDKVFDQPPPARRSETISYLDYPAGTPPDKLAGLLAYRVLQADQSGTRYTLELRGLSVPPQNGQRGKCLSALALM